MISYSPPPTWSGWAAPPFPTTRLHSLGWKRGELLIHSKWVDRQFPHFRPQDCTACRGGAPLRTALPPSRCREPRHVARSNPRSEEHTSELQSPCNLVCRLLLEKKKKTNDQRKILVQ